MIYCGRADQVQWTWWTLCVLFVDIFGAQCTSNLICNQRQFNCSVADVRESERRFSIDGNANGWYKRKFIWKSAIRRTKPHLVDWQFYLIYLKRNGIYCVGQFFVDATNNGQSAREIEATMKCIRPLGWERPLRPFWMNIDICTSFIIIGTRTKRNRLNGRGRELQ